ncbi:MAG: hypothetical protein JJU00_01590 [Opitutales bacterium]|nr:hypothetical protein [Opitutales bacterium]
MKSSPANLVLLIASVLALVGGPVVFVLFIYSPVGLAAGSGVTLFGAAGLWTGMRRIKP